MLTIPMQMKGTAREFAMVCNCCSHFSAADAWFSRYMMTQRQFFFPHNARTANRCLNDYPGVETGKACPKDLNLDCSGWPMKGLVLCKLRESFAISRSSLLFLWLLHRPPRSKAEWTLHHFSLPWTWWRRWSRLQHISPSEPHEAVNPTYHPRHPSSALPFDTSTCFFARRSTHRKKYGWLDWRMPSWPPTRKAMTSWLPSFPFLPLHCEDQVEWSRYPVILRHFTPVSQTVIKMFQPIARYAFFPLFFFCLSHKIIFVQPYAGFVCRKDQWPWGWLYKLSALMTLWWQAVLLKCSRRSMGKGGNPEDGPAIHGMWRTTIHAHEVVISQHIQSKHETPPDIRTASSSTSGTTVTHPVAKSKSIAPQLYSWTWRSLITGLLLDLCFKSNAPKKDGSILRAWSTRGRWLYPKRCLKPFLSWIMNVDYEYDPTRGGADVCKAFWLAGHRCLHGR